MNLRLNTFKNPKSLKVLGLNFIIMKKHFLTLGLLLTVLPFGCNKNDDKNGHPVVEDSFIRAADVSFLPEIESENTIYFNADNVAENVLLTLKNAGCNTIRIRLWKDPAGGRSGMAEVKTLSQRAQQLGLKVWISVHYSDTWADPGSQHTPLQWQAMNFTQLKAAVEAYTSEILTQLDPDIIQIGNEINSGFMWPMGHLYDNQSQSLQLLTAATAVVRAEAPDTKIMLHYAGIEGATYFFNLIHAIDYDYIGLSYYPIFHGKDLALLTSTINTLGQTHGKKVLIAETAYPFTLGYDDFTNNIVGLENQLIPGIPSTPAGQQTFLQHIRNIVANSQYGAGFAYWGGEWIAYRGAEATNGSSWENQALWDFDNKALPVMGVFKKEE